MVKAVGECFMSEEASGYSSSHNFSARKRENNKGGGWKEMEEEEEVVVAAKRRVMVVIDHSTRTKHAMMWALTYVANEGDLLTLLHVLPPQQLNPGCREEDGHHLVNSLSSLCKACKPEVAVEALVIRGPKLATVLNQVRKLEVSVLVLSQSKPSLFSCMLRSSSEDFMEQCINKAECLTMAVRKQSKGVGGYLVSTRWQKNFWLLA